MKTQTIGQYREELSAEDEKGKLIDLAVARAQRLTGRSNLKEIKIGSVEEMGIAAGTCKMCTGEIRVREDQVKTITGIRESLAETLTHEVEHANGNYSEGSTELAATLKTGKSPVPAYREKVEHARHVMSVVSQERYEKLARGKEANVALLQEYVRNKVADNTDIEAAVAVIKEGKRHLDMAA